MDYEKYIKAGIDIDLTFKVRVQNIIGEYPIISDEISKEILFERTMLEYIWQLYSGKDKDEAEMFAKSELFKSILAAKTKIYRTSIKSDEFKS